MNNSTNHHRLYLVLGWLAPLAATLACCYIFYMFSDLAYGMEGEYAREANSTKNMEVLTSYSLRYNYFYFVE